MKTHSDDFDLATELRELRPAPRVEFTAELDARVTGLPEQIGKATPSGLAWIAQGVRGIPPRRVARLAGAAALLAIAASTALISIDRRDTDSSSRPIADHAEPRHRGSNEFSAPLKLAPTGSSPGNSSLSGGAASAAGGKSADADSETSPQYSAAPPIGGRHRRVQRDAELVLRSAPGEIEADAGEVFATVHTVHGIVLDSSVHDWTENAGSHAGEARASFSLLVPSARLGEAMAALSRIASVRSRHESTSDITAPTVTIRDRLRDSQARIDSLVAQLASAEGEGERAEVESSLRRERRTAAALRGQLDRLNRRAGFARVSLRIEGGASESGSATWGVGDALNDAGGILTVAAGVVVIGLAVIGPLALICLIAWLANRAWMRRRRERTLG